MIGRIIAEPPELTREGEGQLATVRLWWRPGRGPERDFLGAATFRFRAPVPLTEIGPEVSLSMALTPSLALGVPIECPVPVSRRFLKSWERMREAMSAWFPGMRPAPLVATPRDTALETPAGLRRGTGCYFSGGVDSWYTLWQLRSEITHLIYMDGFDMDLEKPVARRLSVDRLRAAADEIGLPLVVVETDARNLAMRYYEPWRQYVGAGKGAVAQLLSPWLPTQFAAASYKWHETLTPVSSAHFLLIDGASTETLEMREHGMAAQRLTKVAAVAGIPTALRHLRVCWDMLPDRINCGYCEKCLRTMLELEAVGKLSHCETLPHTITPELLQQVRMPGRKSHVFASWLEVAGKLRYKDPGAPLTAQVTAKVRHEEARHWSGRAWQCGKDLTQTAAWPQMARALGAPVLAAASRWDRDWLLRKCRQTRSRLREELLYRIMDDPKEDLVRRVLRRVRRADA